MRRRFIASTWAAAAAWALSGSAFAQTTPLSMTMDWVPHGLHVPFYYAKKKGWFDEAKIDLKIEDGKGSARTIGLVGAGQSDLGLALQSAVALARVKGVPIRAVATVLRRNDVGLMVPKAANLKKAEDFKGKQIIYTTGSVEATLLQGYLRSAGLKIGDVTPLGVDASAKVSTFVGGTGDALVAPIPFYAGTLSNARGGLEALPFAENGVPMLSLGIVANETVIKEKRAALKSFLVIMTRAFKAMESDAALKEAAAAMAAARPDAKLDIDKTIATYKAYTQFFQTASPSKKPFGTALPQDWEETANTLKRLRLIPQDANASDFYTTEFNQD